MRVYLPLTLPGLAELQRRGELGPAPLPAYAVTPALREWYADGDLEELEYAALSAAARASLRLLAASPQAAPRRVVVAADVPDAAVRVAPLGEGEHGAVVVGQPVVRAEVAAVHVDGAEADGDVARAVAAVAGAGGGDPDAFEVAAAEGHELQWYAAQEIPDLLGSR